MSQRFGGTASCMHAVLQAANEKDSLPDASAATFVLSRILWSSDGSGSFSSRDLSTQAWISAMSEKSFG